MQKWGDDYNLRDLGASMDGTQADEARINAAIGNTPSGSNVRMPCGSWWPNDPDADGNAWSPTTNNWYVYDGTACPLTTNDTWPAPGILNMAIGDYSPYIYNNNHGMWIRRHDRSALVENSPVRDIEHQIDNTTSQSGQSNTVIVNVFNGTGYTAANVSGTNTTGNVSAKPFLATLTSYSNNYGTEDVAGMFQMNKMNDHSNSWGFVTEVNDFSGHSPSQTFSQINELDQTGNGQDNPNSLFDPRASRRWLWYIRPQNRDFGYSWKGYNANTSYSVGDMVAETSNGAYVMFICTKAGKTGASAALWDNASAEYGTVTDGTVTWTRGGTISETVGVGIWFNQDTNNPNPDDYSPKASFNTGISGNQVFHNAFIDTTQMTFPDASGAVIRLGHDQTIDWSGQNLDGQKTDTGRNVHTTAYSSTDQAFEYKVNGTTALGVYDDGSIQTAAAFVTATGSTVDDAASTSTSMVYLNAGEDGQGARVSARLASRGFEQTFYNLSNYDIKLYGIDGGWSFDGRSDKQPIVIHRRGTVTVRNASNGSNNLAYDMGGNNIVSGTLAYLQGIPTAYDGFPAYCTDCTLNGVQGVSVHWNGAKSAWLDSQNNALVN